MNDDDKSFLEKIKKGSTFQSNYFIVIPHNKKPNDLIVYDHSNWKKSDLHKVSPASFTIKTIAVFRLPSLHCDIIYGSSIPLTVSKNPYDTIELSRGKKTADDHKKWGEEQKVINKNVKEHLIKDLNNLLRFYLEKMKNYCATVNKRGRDENTNRFEVLDEKYKICIALGYLENHRGLGDISGNTHVDALQLLLKAHKTNIHWGIDNSAAVNAANKTHINPYQAAWNSATSEERRNAIERAARR